MQYTWYFIINKTEFDELGLVSLPLQLILSGVGLRDVLLTKGNFLSVLSEGVFLPINMNDRNPFPAEDHAVYLDESNNIWLGLPIEN
jgi:hypothetical protein